MAFENNKHGPVIIGGAARSGTTLLLSVLSAHPALTAIPYDTYKLAPPRVFEGFPGGPDVDAFRAEVGEEIWATRWVEKTPFNVRSLTGILEHPDLSDVKFIHIVRDGRDVAVSPYREDSNGYYTRLDEWAPDVHAGLKHANHPRVYTLKYEDLVCDYKETTRSLFAFLDLDAEPVHRYPEGATVDASPHWRHRAIPAHPHSVGRWRRREHAERVLAFLAHPGVVELLEKLGYKNDRSNDKE